MQGRVRDGVPGQEKGTGSKPLKAVECSWVCGCAAATNAPWAGRRGHTGRLGKGTQDLSLELP